jgi:tryptophan synthase alpha chain
MSRIAETFASLRADSRSALIPYVTAGDPDLDTTLAIMHAMVDAGADIIELGVPFSDPMADGPVIQQACERALAKGTRLLDVLDLAARFRESNDSTPLVLMGYMNPVEVLGFENFAERAQKAGIDGVLTVDMPPEESDGMFEALTGHGLDPIYLLSPTTPAERMSHVAEKGSGFVYYVSLKGVTGAATLDVDAVAERVGEIRERTGVPVGVGFGISDASSAAKVGAVADAVVVGSALVKLIAAADSGEQAANDVAALLRDMRAAIDAA